MPTDDLARLVNDFWLRWVHFFRQEPLWAVPIILVVVMFLISRFIKPDKPERLPTN